MLSRYFLPTSWILLINNCSSSLNGLWVNSPWGRRAISLQAEALKNGRLAWVNSRKWRKSSRPSEDEFTELLAKTERNKCKNTRNIAQWFVIYFLRSTVSRLAREISSWTLEDKFHISVRSCNNNCLLFLQNNSKFKNKVKHANLGRCKFISIMHLYRSVSEIKVCSGLQIGSK